MKSAIFALGLVAVGSILGGCAAPAGEGDTEDAVVDSEELVKGPGITLASSDGKLTINVKVADGAQEKTKNQRFVRVTATRGAKSFAMWCGGMGSLGATESQTISCYDYVRTVSDDDNESFDLNITKKDGKYTFTAADGGDGTFFGDKMQVLDPSWRWMGGAPPSIEGELVAKSGAGTSSDGFEMVADVAARLEGVLGAEVKNTQTRPLAVSTLEFGVSNEMEVWTVMRLSKTGSVTVRPTDKVSALRTPGSLKSGLASAATMKERVLATTK